jgi:hypothetical protein
MIEIILIFIRGWHSLDMTSGCSVTVINIIYIYILRYTVLILYLRNFHTSYICAVAYYSFRSNDSEMP